MWNAILSFFRGKSPQSVRWEEVRRQILKRGRNYMISKCKNGTALKFEETPYYYKVAVGKRTWYWNSDTGEFDGTSFRVADKVGMLWVKSRFI
ncbi:hypothetical protein LCGC14_0880430 [marine sediment metagenome]|uniref:Uncharacterized protein n=1 Tax=marine sediment metagenome TaxID=412755 RepID=A0A0F9RLK8_9ZZZZ